MPNKLLKCIVLKKTKLAETDLIITFLCEDGSQIRAVAKGARKPSSTFSSRLELFSLVEILIAVGKNLDIVREVKLIEPFSSIRRDIDKIYCVNPVLELLSCATKTDLPDEQLFPLTVSFLTEVNKIGDVLYGYLAALTSAHLLKTCSYLGFRPMLTNCVECGREHRLCDVDILTSFSFDGGGVLCAHCSKNVESTKISASTLYLVHQLLHTKFSEIALIKTNATTVKSVLEFCNTWILYYLGVKLKSLAILLQ